MGAKKEQKTAKIIANKTDFFTEEPEEIREIVELNEKFLSVLSLL